MGRRVGPSLGKQIKKVIYRCLPECKGCILQSVLEIVWLVEVVRTEDKMLFKSLALPDSLLTLPMSSLGAVH